jgi:GUN4-like/Trypsin-like peptidase domain
MDQTLEEILERCTVKIKVPGKSGWGTGFFVDSDLILTCAHVVKGATSEPVQVYWQNQEAFEVAAIEEIYSDPFDIALLRLSSVSNKFPCVYLDTDIRSSDVFYAFGYPDDFENGAPVTFDCEGITGDNPPLIKFKHGQTRPGLSGSPLLNKRTGRVCGIVKFTRDRATDLGGGGILTETVFSKFINLRERQQEFHGRNKIWSNILKNSLNKAVEIKSELNIDYKPLQALLENEDWVKADEETTKLFRKITNTDSKSLPAVLAIKRFSCSDLETIDSLWVTYSRRRFGFSIQQQIWESIENKSGNSYDVFREFINQVGWLPGDYDFEAGFLRGVFVKDKPRSFPTDLSLPEGFFPMAGFLLPAMNWFDEGEFSAVFKDFNPLDYIAIPGRVAGAFIGTWLRTRSFDYLHYMQPQLKAMGEGFAKKIWQLHGEHSLALIQRLKVCKIK